MQVARITIADRSDLRQRGHRSNHETESDERRETRGEPSHKPLELHAARAAFSSPERHLSTWTLESRGHHELALGLDLARRGAVATDRVAKEIAKFVSRGQQDLVGRVW